MNKENTKIISNLQEKDNVIDIKEQVLHENVQPKEVKNKSNSIIYFSDKNKGLSDENGRISDYIEVIALSRTIDSKEWKKNIHFIDMDGEIRECNISQKTLLKKQETLEMLGDHGFCLSCYSDRLMMYLRYAKPSRRITEVKRIGWINAKAFICPSFIINKDKDKSFSLEDNCKKATGFEEQNTLDEWKGGVCTLCEGNAIPTLSLCAGLSGIVLKQLNLNPIMINLIGRSSIGKTTALYVAASLWGNPKEFIQQWRTTSNALEVIAESYNDCVLILDELGQVSSKDVGNIIYMLGNSKGKSRLNKDSELKENKKWSIAVLSSGEVSISDKITEGGSSVKAGQLVRCIDIDALRSDQFGVFDTMHDDIEDSAQFSNLLKDETMKYYGVAAKAFIQALIDASIDLQSLYEEHKRIIMARLGRGIDGQVIRVAETFALLAMVGDLACTFNVFTHRGNELVDLIHGLFEEWLKNRGTTQSIEEKTVLDCLINSLEANKNRFDLADGTFKTNSPVWWGIRKIFNDSECYYIASGIFQSEIFKGFNMKVVRKILVDKKMLILDGNNKNPKCHYTKPPNKRMVTIEIKQSEMEKESAT